MYHGRHSLSLSIVLCECSCKTESANLPMQVV